MLHFWGLGFRVHGVGLYTMYDEHEVLSMF